MLIIIPNNFGKHLNRTSQIKIVIIEENKTLLEKENCYPNKRMLQQFSVNISDQLEAP